MKKYELREKEIEVRFKNRNKIKPGCTADLGLDTDSELIKSFDDRDEAEEALREYKSSIREVGSVYLVKEFYVEENDYDDDGEWISGGDIWGFSEMKIEVVEKPSYDVKAAFDNFKDAEDYQFNLDDSFLSFT